MRNCEFCLEKPPIIYNASNYNFLIYFSPFSLHSSSLCSSVVTQCHIDRMISEAAFSLQLSYDHLFAHVSLLF